MIPHQPTISHFYANMQYHILPYADQRDTFVAEENKELEMSYTLAVNIYFTILHLISYFNECTVLFLG